MPVTKPATPATKRTIVPLAAAKKGPVAVAPAAVVKPRLAAAKATPAPVAAARAAPAERVPSARGIAGLVAGKKVKKLVENPKRANSKAFDMWEATVDGMTYPELLAAGVSSADIKYNVEHEFIKFV